jgi:glucose-6-phosphate 1-epimerase
MSTAIAITRHQDMDALDLRAPDGARALVLLHGAQLLSWVPAGADEQLYVSPKAAYASGQAVRGGVPVIFPQFSDRGPLQRHGFARSKPWQLLSAEQSADDALAVLRLVDDEATRMFWPHAFEAELTVRVAGRSLEIELACLNTGAERFSFTAALHSYLRVKSLHDVSLSGLAGLHYWDAIDKAEHRQRSDLLLPGAPGAEDLDRVYHQVRQDLTLREQGIDGKTRTLGISQQGFADTVVWNPGAERCAALIDMPADGWRHMLCVEAAAIEHPIALEPGQEWSGMQTLTLTP